MNESLKTCKRCGNEKSVELFPKRHKRPGVYQNICKKCKNDKDVLRQRSNLQAKRDRSYRTYDPIKKKAQYERLMSDPAQRQKAIDRSRSYRLRNRLKAKAHEQAQYAVKMGRLVKPDACQECGQKSNVDGHHKDYSKPLEVIWLCRPCHRKQHRKESKALTTHNEGKEK